MGLMAASGHNGMKSRRIVEFLHAQVGQLINVHEVQHGQKEESPKSKWRTMAMCFGESVLSNLTSQTPQARRSFGKTQEELIGIGREDGCATSGSEGYFSKQFSGVLHVNPRLVTPSLAYSALSTDEHQADTTLRDCQSTSCNCEEDELKDSQMN